MPRQLTSRRAADACVGAATAQQIRVQASAIGVQRWRRSQPTRTASAATAQYGYVNRVLPDAGLAGFVDAFATRIAGFDKTAVADTKALLDVASLPPDEEFAPGLAAFFRTSGRPEGAARVGYLFDRGFQTPDGVERDLGRAVADYSVRG
jgi:hypothetical protein